MRVLDAIAAEPGPLYLVGSCKNAGKTTLLNFLNDELAKRLPTPPGLATIGRDGEPEDAIWRHPKPSVRLLPGSLFVTVEPELRRLSGAAQPVEHLPFSTALGPVVIGEACLAATVELVGPDTNSQLWTAIDRLRALGATHQLIDGAYDRRTQVASHDGARVALVVSADVAPTLDDLHRWLLFQLELFGLGVSALAPHVPTGAPWGFHWHDGENWSPIARAPRAVFCSGPLTETLIEGYWDALDDVELVVEDATKVFVGRRNWQALRHHCRDVCVLRMLRLVLLAANPSGLLREFPPREFFDALQPPYGNIPMIDVVANLRRET